MIHCAEIHTLPAGLDNTNPHAQFWYSTCSCGVNSPMLLSPEDAENAEAGHLHSAFKAGEEIDLSC